MNGLGFKARKPWPRVVAISLLGGGIVAYLTLLAPIPFERSRWLAAQQNWADSLHRRERMADWLLLRGTLLGKTRQEVVVLLGEPPPTEYFADWSLVYNLGAERGFISIDSEWLLIRLGANGRVSEAKIGRD